MIDVAETDERWFTFQPIEGVRFSLNEAVRVTRDEHLGKLGSIVALTSLEPISYLVELATGGDIELFETELEPQD